MHQFPTQICTDNQTESNRIKQLAEKELYRTVFDVWVDSGRDLKYSRELWDYFCVVVSPNMMAQMPDEEEFIGILPTEQNRRRRLRE